MGIFAGYDISRLASLNAESVNTSSKYNSKSTDVSSLKYLHSTGCECSNHHILESSATEHSEYTTDFLNKVSYHDGKRMKIVGSTVIVRDSEQK